MWKLCVFFLTLLPPPYVPIELRGSYPKRFSYNNARSCFLLQVTAVDLWYGTESKKAVIVLFIYYTLLIISSSLGVVTSVMKDDNHHILSFNQIVHVHVFIWNYKCVSPTSWELLVNAETTKLCINWITGKTINCTKNKQQCLTFR